MGMELRRSADPISPGSSPRPARPPHQHLLGVQINSRSFYFRNDDRLLAADTHRSFLIRPGHCLIGNMASSVMWDVR